MLDMKEAFYIIKVSEQLYQVRLTFNKECISTATSLEQALERINTLVDRYNTLENLIECWNSTDLKPSKTHELARNQKIYEEQGHEYKEEVEKLFTKAKPKLLTKRNKTLSPKIEIPKKEEPLEPSTTPKLIKPKKKILFKK